MQVKTALLPSATGKSSCLAAAAQTVVSCIVYIAFVHRETEKRNHVSFMKKSVNMSCNLTKFSIVIVNEYYHRYYLFHLWNLQ